MKKYRIYGCHRIGGEVKRVLYEGTALHHAVLVAATLGKLCESSMLYGRDGQNHSEPYERVIMVAEEAGDKTVLSGYDEGEKIPTDYPFIISDEMKNEIVSRLNNKEDIILEFYYSGC